MRRLWREISTHGRDRLATPEERRLAGGSSAALWLCGALTLLVMLPLPGPRLDRPALVATVAALALAWGVTQLRVVPWERVGSWVFHVSTSLLVVTVAVLEPFSGGVDSPTHEYLWLVVVYAAFFYPAWPAAAYWLACGVVSGMPLLYADSAVEHNRARELFILVLAYAIVGAIVYAGREVLAGLSRRATALGEEQARLAAEQSSLRRVATAVAAGSPPQAIFALVSAEAGRLLGADAAAIGRFLGDTRVQATGVWATTGETYTQPGQTYELEPTDELARVYATGRPVRLLDEDARRPSKTRALGYHSFVAAPVYEGTTVWASWASPRTGPTRSHPAPRTGCASTPR